MGVQSFNIHWYTPFYKQSIYKTLQPSLLWLVILKVLKLYNFIKLYCFNACKCCELIRRTVCIAGFGAQSIPIGIPGGLQRGSIGSLSQSPPSPFGSFSHSLLTGNQKHESGEQVRAIMIREDRNANLFCSVGWSLKHFNFFPHFYSVAVLQTNKIWVVRGFRIFVQLLWGRKISGVPPLPNNLRKRI